MKVLSIVGARPQFVKAAVVSRALKRHRKIREFLLHTGQHHDAEMSEIFFRQLGIPKPYRNLGIHGGTHGEMTARMLVGIEKECRRIRPDWILIYGDTNSTLAGALVGAKLQVPVAHVEAGLRSFNRKMPEEINRIVSDRLSQLLFVPTPEGVANLKGEGVRGRIHRVGDVMVDAIRLFRDRSRRLSGQRVAALVPDGPYYVLTLHRQENTDDPRRLRAIFAGLSHSRIPFVFPIHPRTKKTIQRLKLSIPPIVRVMRPVSYLEMILLQDRAQAVWTDSGGMQKEAVVLGKPCYTLRDQTEWVETVRHGWNRLLGASATSIRKALRETRRTLPSKAFPTRRYYGDGKAAERIARVIAASDL